MRAASHGLMSDAMVGAGSARGLRKLYGGQRLSPRPRAVGFVRLCDDGRPATLASCGFKPDASLIIVSGSGRRARRRRRRLPGLLGRLGGEAVEAACNSSAYERSRIDFDARGRATASIYNYASSSNLLLRRALH